MFRVISFIFLILFPIHNLMADDPLPGFFYEVTPADDCPKLYEQNNHFGSEVEWHQCNSEALIDAEQNLNELYKKLTLFIQTVDDDSSRVEQLKKAQRSWLKFRDAQCKMVYYTYGGGSAAPARETQCNLTLTKNRLTELNRFKVWEE